MASKTTRSSKARVKALSCRAKETSATVTPWVGQLTRGASATRSQVAMPMSMWRHRRVPPPLSNHGETTPHLPQRPRTRALHYTVESDVADDGDRHVCLLRSLCHTGCING